MRVIVDSTTSPPLLALMIIGKVPVAVEFVVVMVRVEEKGGFCVCGLKAAVTSDGAFNRLS